MSDLRKRTPTLSRLSPSVSRPDEEGVSSRSRNGRKTLVTWFSAMLVLIVCSSAVVLWPRRRHYYTNHVAGHESHSMANHIITRIRNGTVTSLSNKIPVVVWPHADFGSETAATRHTIDGVNQSSILVLSSDLWNFDLNVVWLAEIADKYYADEFCNALHKRVVNVMQRRRKLGHELAWPLFILDWTDQGKDLRCHNVEAALGRSFVQYSQRSVVSHRFWSKKRDWVKVGRVTLDGVHRPIQFAVRTDTIQELTHVLEEEHDMNLTSPIEQLEREMDVSHFWPEDSEGVGLYEASLRQKVTRVVANMRNTTDLKVFVGLAGRARDKGRHGVKAKYIKAMLNTKIIVVSQRDSYEDHYRLFEGLVSGAMIMTDRMLTLPQGLENGTSVVEFESAQDLVSKILYYISHAEERLEIAKRGREVSMRRHRTWHRMEQVIFGKPISDCTQETPTSSCPWIVHASHAQS